MVNLLSFLWPKVLEKSFSPISGQIKVVEQFGKCSLEVGGITQSGGIVEKIWKKTIVSLFHCYIVERVLILGLG